MGAELSLARFVTHLRMAGHDFDTIALALAAGAVDALVAAGFRGSTLDGGLLRVVEAMWERVSELQGPPPPPDDSGPPRKPKPRLTLLTGPHVP